MRRTPPAVLVTLLVVCLSVPSSALAREIDRARLPAAVSRTVQFGKDVLPILENHCFACHSGPDARTGLRLDVRAVLLGSGNAEDAFVLPGKSADSRLVHVVSGLLPERETMPPTGKGKRLSAEQVGILRAWIDQGVRWDDLLLPPPGSEKHHWAFQPIRRPALPRVKNSRWTRNPIDVFVALGHERHGLKPAAQADRPTLIRRLMLDLHGLPPTPDEVERFVGDSAPDAYEKLVDRLLASPRYGERWGRHWLDVARYAESDGYEHNYYRPHAWRYRDYVIDSFNADRPFSHFIRQQLAGDELKPFSDENLIATGFLASARYCSNEEDKAIQRNDVLVDITNVVSSAFLGLTFSCAQCHDHKYDPIAQKDYYRLQGFFVRGQVLNVNLKDPLLWSAYEAQKPPAYERAVQMRRQLLDVARVRLGDKARGKPDDQLVRAVGDGGRLAEALQKRIEALKKILPDVPQTFAYYSPVSASLVLDIRTLQGDFPLPYRPDELKKVQPRLLVRGDPHRPKTALDPGVPALFGAGKKTGTRSELADWLVSRDNPLTARVWVNRLWHYHFGRGISATPGDLGLRGARPTHPELLDWLASELLDNGWNTRRLHRLMVLSATYRQASRGDETARAKDPTNIYWTRWQPRRLESEALRDAILRVSGELDLTAGGPGIALVEKRKYGNEPAEEGAPPYRRSVYLQHRRQTLAPFTETFDGPTANETCPQRHVSTVALQPLFLLNSPFMTDRSRALAHRLRQAGPDVGAVISLGFRLTLGREPQERERRIVGTLFDKANEDTARDEACVRLAQVLLNLNEFCYLN
jgi:hypothetical protein